MSKKISSITKARTGNASSEKKYVLQLFIAGISPNSIRAITNIQSICEEHLKGQYELEIIDIYQQPELAIAEEIIAIPLLVKRHPEPLERLIGDLSEVSTVLKLLKLN